ncbi:hypothetical protein SLEP1_g54646 [Rubroshorea leprosula]|uniref:AAA+ ATPase domain-containing protein n=1 Tax=Rubroshorea leprosula TaxID=152421 RepID=A0AAV5MGT2_9ROSI|nr:hypothetical protein SLEP1_g54646 [Rubroshorea leprosula]
MEALQSQSSSIIGVHGMPGLGKTMLAKEVQRKAEQDKLFDAVVMALVTRNVDLKKIQVEIARGLGLDQLPNGITTQDAAERIKERLKKMKKVLIILDDIWVPGIDLEELGIPLRNEPKEIEGSSSREEGVECKILMTSRDSDVLSDLMDSPLNFSLHQLESGEAWELLKKAVGDRAESEELHGTAIEIVRECGGLPLAITTIAKALKNKKPFEWRDALRKLRKPSSENFDGISANVYSAIEVSYSSLESEKLKKTFLLCCLLGHKASIEDLLTYGVGLGLFANTIEEARDEVFTLISKLRASSLLIDDYDNDSFDMHDLIHDVAVSITSRDRHGLLLTGDHVPREWSDMETRKDFKWICLRSSNVDGLPEELESRCLTLFLLENKNPSLQIPANFFKGMPRLKVLDLTCMHMSSLPSSICLLQNLHTLCLDRSVLRDIRVIGELKNLEILSLFRSDFEELPGEIGQLTQLKLLDLSNCTKLKIIPPCVLANMSRLEELYLRNSFHGWEVEENENQRNASLAELKHLKKLTSLEVCIPDIGMIPKDMFFENLKKFKIFIGSKWEDQYRSFGSSRILKLHLNTSINANDLVKMLLKKTEELHLRELAGIENVVDELNTGGFPDSKRLYVRNAPEVQHIIKSAEGVSFNAFPSLEVEFPNLEELQLSWINVNIIWHASMTSSYFEKLTKLIIEHCDNLEYLFTSPMARDLVMLEHLQIQGCKKMRKVLFTENEEENRNLIFPQLRILEIKSLPKLEGFCHGNRIKFPCLSRLLIMSCPELKTFISSSSSVDNCTPPLFDRKVTFPKLEELMIKFMENLEKIWDNQLDASSFCQLNYLSVNSCNKLLNIFPFSMLERLQRLDKLEMWSCHSLEEIFESQGLDVGQSQTQKFTPPSLMESVAKFEFPKLTQLDLYFLPKLKALCHQMHTAEWPSLKKLNVCGCKQVQIFASELSSFPRTNGDDQLEVDSKYSLFWTGKCSELKNLVPSFISFKNLTTLEVSACHKLINLIEYSTAKSMVQLTRMSISECYMLKEIVACVDDEVKDGIVFSQLKYLQLCGLPRLASFCSGSCGFEFVSLEEVTVMGCPNMEIFSHGECSTPKKLQLVKLTKYRNDWFWEGNLNSTIQKMFIEKVGYHGLENLKFSELPEVIEIWNQKPQEILPFKSLKSLDVCNYNNSKYLLTSSMALGLVQLYSLKVINCATMEQVITGEGAEEMFPKLNSINLESCANLKYFYEGSSRLEFPQLIKITVVNCPVFAAFTSSFSSDQKKEVTSNDTESEERLVIPIQPFFSDKVVLPNLEELQLHWMNVNIKWHTSITYLCVRKLKKLIIQGCDNLEYLFSSSIARGLVMLGQVEIRECKRMRKVIVTENVEEKENLIFPQLNFLLLKDLQNIVGFYSGDCIVEFPSLKQLQVLNCPELEGFIVKYFASANVIADKQPFFNEQVAFPNLESLTLTHLKNLDVIWHNQFHADSFGKLKSLTVTNCEKLSTIFPSADMLGRIWKSLEKLIIYFCGSLEVVFGIAEFNVNLTHAIIDTKLRELNIGVLPRLKYVWNKDPQGILTFHNLESVDIGFCERLKILFPASIGKSLSQLQKLHLFRCGVEEIVTMGEQGNEAVVDFEFPQVSSLKLEWLPRLQCFHPGKHTTAWPKLKKFYFSLFNQVKRTDGGWQLDFPIRLPLFSMEKVIPQLEELLLTRHELQLLQRFCHLEELVVEFCNFKGLFPSKGEIEEQEKHIEIETLSRIKTLNLKHLPYLRHIWSCDSSIVLQNLETLQVSRCDNLITLSTSPAFFQNLVTLNISRCEIMVNLVSISIAQSLVRLERLIVSWCYMLTKIVGNEGNGTQDLIMITFTKLRFLKLECLPRLERFGSRNFTFKFPSLKELIVIQSPKLMIFNEGDLSTPLLQRVELIEREEKWRWESDLNTTIQRMYMEEVGFAGLQLLMLSSFPKLLETWHIKNPQELLDFRQLRVLEICNCSKFRYLLTHSMALGLVQLWQLMVKNCGTMEQVIMGEGAKNKMEFPHLWLINLESCSDLTSFHVETPNLEFLSLSSNNIQRILDNSILEISSYIQNLRKLCVEGCGNLEYLLTSSMVKSFEQLNWLKICDCNMMEEVIHAEESMDEEIMCKIFFPNLEFLLLQDLPKLTRFCSGNYLELPCLWKLKISKCPVLKTFISSFFFGDMIASSQNVKNTYTLSLFNAKVAFPKLERLVIEHVNSLNKIWNDQLEVDSFCQLTLVSVVSCEKLLNIFPFSMLERLQRLDKLQIWNCDSLEEILESHEPGVSQSQAQKATPLPLLETVTCLEDDVKDEIVFSKLKYLQLCSLPRLSSFCSVKCKFEFPLLEEVIFLDCPSMQTFSMDEIRTPKLQKAKLTRDEDEGFGDGNLNLTVQLQFIQKSQGDSEI